MSRTILVTGVTGFIGGSLVLELLKDSDDTIMCLTRGGNNASAADRLDVALTRACESYDEEALLPAVRERCVVMEGDITAPFCGVDSGALGKVDEVWHSAASLAFEDEHEEEITRANVEGTRHILDLVKAVGADTYNHFSTAYVGGAREGVVREDIPPSDTPCNNAYERSKLAAEHVVAAADIERIRIFRPSIVIGHSRTKVATTFTGLYGFVRNLRRLQRDVDPVLGNLLNHRSLRLIAQADSPINLVSVDYVTGPAVAISRSDDDAMVYHLTNSAPPELDVPMKVIAAQVGIRPPRYVASADDLNLIDERVDDKLKFYGSYMRNVKVFDRTNSDNVLGAGSGAAPLDAEALDAYVGWYVDVLNAQAEKRPETSQGVF